MLLTGKVTVIYGAGGAIGGAVARAFAAEDARLFLTDRSRQPVEIVANDIAAAGGTAEVAEVDALDEQAVDRHLWYVSAMAGRVDISVNSIGLSRSGRPASEMAAGDLTEPIAAYVTSFLLTARLAARRMIPRASGVIMTVSASAVSAAVARELAAEAGPRGIRVIGLHPAGPAQTAGELARMAALLACGRDGSMPGTPLTAGSGTS
jgi:NAD(P)-dependent dehydrogenase (short-subunit alcohol dehydrogenase family)